MKNQYFKHFFNYFIVIIFAYLSIYTVNAQDFLQTIVIADNNFNQWVLDFKKKAQSEGISSNTVNKIMDKAISVGERSNLIAKNLTVLSSNMGIVSKDSSKTLVTDSLFENINEYALMSYIKKEQFEGAMLDCKKCVFNIEKDKILFKDEFSSITF